MVSLLLKRGAEIEARDDVRRRAGHSLCLDALMHLCIYMVYLLESLCDVAKYSIMDRKREAHREYINLHINIDT